MLASCVVALLAFPFAATFAASRQLDDDGGRFDVPTATNHAGPGLRDLPTFSAGGPVAGAVARGRLLTDAAAMRSALRGAMSRLFGADDRRALERLVASDHLADDFNGYPYRFPDLEPLLDRAGLRHPSAQRAAVANDLGALLVLAAARFGERRRAFRQAARVAFAVLDRARSSGACRPQLNLAFLLTTDDDASSTASELRTAAKTCPRDPTPLWVLGQIESQNAVSDDPPRRSRALPVFRRLQQRFPRSPAGWSGEADHELRLAYRSGDAEPFSARYHFTRALASYDHALDLAPRDSELQPGAARAYAGLGHADDAVTAQRAALRGQRDAAPLQARLVEYLERAHEFADAADAASRLTSARFAAGPGLFSTPSLEFHDAILDEDAQGPLSSGAGRLVEVSLEWAPTLSTLPTGESVGSAGTAVSDFSFIPQFRAVDGLTNIDRWCPAFSRRRDLVLARRAQEALDGRRSSFTDVRPDEEGRDCDGIDSETATLLTHVAELELRPREAAARHSRARMATLQDARQNMWRFAGDLPRARRVSEQWAKAAPHDPRPLDRAGEIAFLAKRYDEAARQFAKAVRLARARAGSWSLDEAAALVKRGTALELGRRYAEAQVAFAAGDEVASRILGAKRTRDDPGARAQGAFLAYTARAQSGDTFLRTRNVAAADEQYVAAREQEATLSACECTPGRRPEVIDNNHALVAIGLGRLAPALRAARRAVRADPLNPLFLQTLGLAQRRAGLLDRSESSYRTAIRSDPSLYPAANDLGIVLASRRRYAAAADAFRAALSAQPRYAAGWFNLGIALERRGPGHALASQGSFARAFRLDDGLSGSVHRFISDDRILFAKLDLSKPLPADWGYAASQDRAPATAAGFALALLLALRLGRGLLSDGAGSNARKYLEVLRERLSRLHAFTPAAVAVAATLGVLLWPTLHSDASLTSVLALLLGSAALTTIVLRARRLVGRAAGADPRQRGWAPGIVAACAATVIGAGWAPLPVVESEHDARVVHWIGPLCAALMGIALLALGTWLAVPATMSLGTVGLVMAASMLVPIKPLDAASSATARSRW